MSVAELRQPARLTAREEILGARRIVVKIGSSSLTDARGRLDQSRLDGVAEVAATLASRGTELVLVSSGAIAAALGPLGLPERPTSVPLQQAAASVGQALLATACAGGGDDGTTAGTTTETTAETTAESAAGQRRE